MVWPRGVEMDEKGFKGLIKKSLKKKGFFCFCPFETYRAGVPDVYACLNGMSVWLELKYSDSETLSHPLTPQQAIFLREINDKGGLGLMMVGQPDNMVYTQRVTEAGKITKFDKEKNQTLEEAIHWIVQETQRWTKEQSSNGESTSKQQKK